MSTLKKQKVVDVASLLAARLNRDNGFCIVGSGVFEIFGLRDARDVDIVLNPNLEPTEIGQIMSLVESKPSLSLSIVRAPYLRSGVDDFSLFADEYSVSHPAGFRISRPELEFARKNHRRLKKDLSDLEEMSNLVKSELPKIPEMNFHSWDWLLATVSPSTASTLLSKKLKTAAKLLISRPWGLLFLLLRQFRSTLRISVKGPLLPIIRKRNEAFRLQTYLIRKLEEDRKTVDNEINTLRASKELQEAKSVGAFVPFIVWRDALPLFSEVVEQLSKHGYVFDPHHRSPRCATELNSLIESIYSLDGLRPWLIERKKTLVGGGDSKIGVFYFLPKKPELELRVGAQSPKKLIYKSVVNAKFTLRTLLSESQSIPWDQIIHSADNPVSSRQQNELIENFGDREES